MKVIQFQPPKAAINQKAVDELRETMARVLSGEIVGIAIAGVMNDGSGFEAVAPGGKLISLLGSLALVNHTLCGMAEDFTLDPMPPSPDDDSA